MNAPTDQPTDTHTHSRKDRSMQNIRCIMQWICQSKKSLFVFMLFNIHCSYFSLSVSRWLIFLIESHKYLAQSAFNAITMIFRCGFYWWCLENWLWLIQIGYCNNGHSICLFLFWISVSARSCNTKIYRKLWPVTNNVIWYIDSNLMFCMLAEMRIASAERWTEIERKTQNFIKIFNYLFKFYEVNFGWIIPFRETHMIVQIFATILLFIGMNVTINLNRVSFYFRIYFSWNAITSFFFVSKHGNETLLKAYSRVKLCQKFALFIWEFFF